MAKDLGILRWVDLEHDVDVGEIETTRSNVCAEKDARSRSGEGDEGGKSGGAADGGHLAVEGVDGEEGDGRVDGEELWERA